MSEALALMSRDDADEILVAQLGVFLLAAKHSDTHADEFILQAAIDSRDVRLWLLDTLGFEDSSEPLNFSSPVPLLENAATLVELVRFLKTYGPQLKAAIQAIVELIQLFKGLAPSVPEVGDGVIRHPKF
jgi:hypothetical protein